MAAKKVKERSAKRGARSFLLGPPGAIVRLEYTLETRWERLTSTLSAIAMVVGGSVFAFAQGQGIGVLIAAGVVVLGAAWLFSLRKQKLGRVVLDASSVEIGPTDRPRSIPLPDVLQMMQSAQSSFGDPRVTFGVHFALHGEKQGGVSLAAALIPRDHADELATRMALRRRAALADDTRAAEAVEARHLAGAGVIGVYLERGKWKPFSSTDALVSGLGAHPFRSTAERIPICVSSPVWEAIRTLPDVVNRVTPIVVPD